MDRFMIKRAAFMYIYSGGRPGGRSLIAMDYEVEQMFPRRTTAVPVKDRLKISRVQSELSRARLKKDKHLIKQLESKLRLLNPY